MWCVYTHTHTHTHTHTEWNTTQTLKRMKSGVTWIDLEHIKLSKMSQTEKDKHCMMLLMCGI